MAPAPSPALTARASRAPTSSRARATRAATSPRSPRSSGAGPHRPDRAVASLTIHGAFIPLARSNVDTDLIIPSLYMKAATRDALAKGAFEALRGDPTNPFDDPRYRGAP